MITYKLVVEYEGTRYSGWQKQKNARTVAGELELAIGRALGHTAGTAAATERGPAPATERNPAPAKERNPVLELGGAGRTDAGVHALAQVAHLRLDERAAPDASALLRSVNDELPTDVHIIDLAVAPLRFHARHAAISRSYLYQISRRRTALAKRYVWWPKHALDVDAMQHAIALVPGRHDFRLFCERAKDETSTIAVVERAEIVESGALVLVRFEASHFLWRMVRRLVGALARVGAGELTADEFAQLLAAQSLSPGRGPNDKGAGWTAPASGLFLERVRYPGDPPLGPLESAVPVSSGASGVATRP